MILRLPQVVGTTPNPYTLTNYIHHQVTNGIRFRVWANAWRNLIDVSDVAKIGGHIITHHASVSTIYTIANPTSIPMTHLVATFEEVLGKCAQFDLIDAGTKYRIDSTFSHEIAERVGIIFDDQYTFNLIQKYYG